MKKRILSIICTIVSVLASAAQDSITLSFDESGKFTIAQFTDLHWSDKSSGCKETAATIEHVLAVEKPDLAILTGDIVTNTPAISAWTSIAEIFEKYRTPWAITLGNHDTESGLSGDEIFNLLRNKPYFIGEKGPEITGCGNYSILVRNSGKQSVAAVLYCFDSNNKPPAHKYGQYDWIHFDQIEWYRKLSDRYSQENSQPLPALAFFHIPLLEFNQISKQERTIGNEKEGIASPRINSGLFASMLEKQDVMGIFVGHDHNNDYLGTEHGIALAFGRVTGADAYGELERGARIIVLNENNFQFDTWIRTQMGVEFMYYFPSGISRQEEENAKYLPAKLIRPKQQGVAYTYYEGRPFKHTSDIKKTQPVHSGVINNISLSPATSLDSMAFEFNSWIQIPETGIYNFYTYSDDGSLLFIDDVLVVDNDGSHSLRRKDGKIALEKGFHALKILYFDNYMGELLEVGFSGKNIRENILPDHLLFLAE